MEAPVDAYEEAIEKMASVIWEGTTSAVKWPDAQRLMRAAAEAIGLKEMMEALEPFAKLAENDDPDMPDEAAASHVWGDEITAGDCRRALRALTNRNPNP
jgi:hypothetical protein